MYKFYRLALCGCKIGEFKIVCHVCVHLFVFTLLRACLKKQVRGHQSQTFVDMYQCVLQSRNSRFIVLFDVESATTGVMDVHETNVIEKMPDSHLELKVFKVIF